jgi:hypothetical protein
MTGGILGFLVFAVLIPLIVNEAGDLSQYLARRLPADVPALGAVQHRVRGEQRDVRVGVTAGGRLVGAGDDVQDGQPVSGGQAQEPGRSHAAIRARRSSGKTALGMTACTALGGMEV